MPLPFSDFPAHRACLTRVGGVDVDHAQTSGFGLVFDEALQLPEGPAMQSCPDTLTSLDTGADVGQVFHADFAGSGTDGFCDDGFAGFVVDVPPQYTSQTCPCCGHVSKDNRQTQAKFQCVECGFEENADLVGAINILARGHRVLACGEPVQSGRSVKQEPTEATHAIAA